MRRPARPRDDDPRWYKDAIVYELHVRSFFDSDGDGIGDLKGLVSKLDYLVELGVTAIWLLPFYPSPLRDDGYDIADYRSVHGSYGTIKHFEELLEVAHARGLRVITELVINHTSDQHPWFQRARRAPAGSPERAFYVWSDSPERYASARIIFKDFEHSNWSWDPIAKQYYWHRFYAHQPDLNFDNPAVREAVLRVLDFWMGMGVDGLRLDAVPYLFEREGTDCENLPETHAFLRELRAYVDGKYPHRLLLAEANQWPEDAAAYFGDGDECHMNFHFPVMPRLFMALRMEDRFPILDILRQTPEPPDGAQWGLFLRNHDELTLEMVTDEERDYMYRVYAFDERSRINLGIRRRLAPLLGNNRRAIELLHALLFSLPGTPFLYYGDELGMGDNVFLGDRNGVRTPMQWSADRNAGFSRANPQSLFLPVIVDPEYHFEAVNAEAQRSNPNSLLWWVRSLISLRKRHKAFGRGAIEFLEPHNHRVLAFVRTHEEDAVLVVANLSRFAQYVELDLERWAEMRPVELFGRTPFPEIRDEPWRLTLGPHSFYWFRLSHADALVPAPRVGEGVHLELEGRWELVAAEGHREELEVALAGWLVGRRWFGGKARRPEEFELEDVVPLGRGAGLLTQVVVRYAEGDPDVYLVPLAFVEGADAEALAAEHPGAVVARMTAAGRAGLLVDGVHSERLRLELLDLVRRRRSARGDVGTVVGLRRRGMADLWRGLDADRPARLLGAEQSNTSIVFDDQVILKLYRRLDQGLNPDLEMGLFLSERARFTHAPAVGGWLEYDLHRGTRSLASVHAYVPNEGDAWTYTLDAAERFLEQVMADGEPPDVGGSLFDRDAVPAVRAVAAPYLDAARVLGRRTAELHHALASDDEDPDFRPEPFTPFARRALYQSIRNQVTRGLRTLRGQLGSLPEEHRAEARALLAQEDALLDRLRTELRRDLRSRRTRIHGDYHLGQVLRTGDDFVIIDFEGEPALPLGERRLKRSPMRDVAGMLRSFDYAAVFALRRGLARRMTLATDEDEEPARWARAWTHAVSGCFLGAYLEHARDSAFLADADEAELEALLLVHRIEKVVYELRYELDNRPEWIGIPLAGLRRVCRELQLQEASR